MSPPQWKPPVWLLAIDALSIVLLGLGLSLQYAPDGPVAQTLTPAWRLPLLVAGGVGMSLGGMLAVRSILAHRRG